jgi:hypothetical protein
MLRSWRFNVALVKITTQFAIKKNKVFFSLIDMFCKLILYWYPIKIKHFPCHTIKLCVVEGFDGIHDCYYM